MPEGATCLLTLDVFTAFFLPKISWMVFLFQPPMSLLALHAHVTAPINIISSMKFFFSLPIFAIVFFIPENKRVSTVVLDVMRKNTFILLMLPEIRAVDSLVQVFNKVVIYVFFVY